MKLKVYGGNHHGIFRRIVAAPTKKVAAELLGVTLYYFNQFFCETGNKKEIDICMSEPLTLFEQPLNKSGAEFKKVE